MQQKMGVTEWLLLFVLSVLWGGSFFFSKIALAELPPFTVVFARVCMGAFLLIAFIYMTGQRMPKEGHVWKAFFCMGVLNNLIPFSLIFFGQTQIASGLASILNATTPLFSVLFMRLFLYEVKLSFWKMVGVASGLGGVALAIGTEALQGMNNHVLAEAAVIGAAVSYALAGMYARRFKQLQVSSLAIAGGQLSASTLLMLPIALVVDQPWALPVPSATTLLALLGLATLSTAVAYVIYFRILNAAGATNVLLVTFLVPISAIILGVLFLGERLEPHHFGGMACIGFGLIAIDGRLLSRRARVSA